MFVILYYDVNEKRCSKMLKICRKYLIHVQNSVFEGEITIANLEKLISELKKAMIDDEDSLVIYKFRSMNYSERLIFGIDKKGDTQFL
ncbi:MAG: CRISPR-associated endonuclease Cas2 [Deferribacterales bacterium]|nr:CRISPR-associated endonuclease Cas2 [Deferribacterales bacterium]